MLNQRSAIVLTPRVTALSTIARTVTVTMTSIVSGIVIGIVGGLLFSSRAGHSAEYLTLTYGSFARTLVIDQLAQRCTTGTLPPEAHELEAILALLAVETDNLCDALTEEVAIDPVELDQVLQSRIGEDLLFVLGQVIHTRPRVAPITSLRGALLTASEDGTLQGLEILERYPPPEVMIDLARLFSEDWINDDLEGLSRDFSWDILNDAAP